MKRGLSGLSLMVGIDKPPTMSSHDVVNRCRKIFGERRVGHNGTLDPMASGVLLACIGPATRLNPYLTLHDKKYRFKINFGAATDTDDACGNIIREAKVPFEIMEIDFARSFIKGIEGAQEQVPPAYCAVKKQGEKAYEAARAGRSVDLEARSVEIYQAEAVSVGAGQEGSYPFWEIVAHVSKGTYIRSIARDIGEALGIPAHVGELRREQLGSLGVSECVSLEELEDLKEGAALDPVSLLGYRTIFVPDGEVGPLKNGVCLRASEYQLYEAPLPCASRDHCLCSTGTFSSDKEYQPNEIISVVAENRLLGLYQFDQEMHMLKAKCIFPVGVSRGKNL